MLGCLLGENWTTSMLVEMVSTPDGHLLGRSEGEASCQAFLGETDDLIRNINGVAKVAGLDDALLESKTLRKQAASNSKEKISHSPDLKTAILNAIMEALEAHTTMSTQALESEKVLGTEGHPPRARAAL
jgi:hypothetical protein